LWRRLYRHIVRRRLLYAVAGSLAVLAVSSLPVKLPTPVSAQDKAFHTLSYFFVGLAYINACAPGWRHITVPRALLALLALTLFAIGDEVHQAFVPSRVCDPKDVVADVLGGVGATLVGIVLGMALRRVRRRPAVAGAWSGA